MNYQRCFIVKVNGIEVARYKGNPGSAFQIATNCASGIHDEYQSRVNNGELEYADTEITINGRNIKEYIY